MINARKKILILPSMQKKMISPFLWMGVGVVVINLVGNLFFLNRLLGTLNEETSPDTVRMLMDAYWWSSANMLIVNGLLLVAFAYFFLNFSNRLAGPVYQIMNRLKKFNETGQFDEIRLRDTDMLKDLADQINQAFQKKN